MSYHIYKLKFPNGIHVGASNGVGLESTDMSVRSDVFYSALYSEYMKIYGDEKLYELTSNGDFKVSDLFPFKNSTLYLPKPFVSIDRVKEKRERTVDRKK